MTHNQTIGRWGEDLAARHLQSRGDQILARNVRTPYGEIDLVSNRGGLTVFIEVKARTSGAFGNPEDAITPRKQAHLLAAAQHYAAEHAIDHWQVDVIAVQGKPGQTPHLLHLENVLT